MQDYQIRDKIHPKQTVRIGVKVNGVYDEKNDVTGRIKAILTKTDVHARGIKVMLEDGTVGRVKEIIRISK